MCQYFGLETSVPFPPLYKMAYQIAIFFVMEDAWHYWAHRLMHASSFLYKNIHKIHHQYSAPFGLAAEYASPIEVMVLGFGTVGCPIVWCAITKDLHILTMYCWIVLRVFQAIDAHSGYEFPWSLHHFLPFWAGAEHHDVHHEKFIGNYASSFRWWDFCLDTEAGAEASKARRRRSWPRPRRRPGRPSKRSAFSRTRSCVEYGEDDFDDGFSHLLNRSYRSLERRFESHIGYGVQARRQPCMCRWVATLEDHGPPVMAAVNMW